MIVCCTYDNLQMTGAAFNAQFKLRHRSFLERQSYNVKSYDLKEYDQFDTPAAVYLVYVGSLGRALGASRLTPTAHSCMISELWPEMVSDPKVITGEKTWEGTRFCVDRDVPPDLRRIISHELVLAYLEYGLVKGINKIVGVMPTYILRSVFRASGVVFETLGPSKRIDGANVQAASMNVTPAQLRRTRMVTGINKSMLYFPCVESKQLQVA